jgi:hypothetical protein
MSFVENLFKKIEINAITRKVLSTIGPVGGSLKVDKDAMGKLLFLARYTRQEKRQLLLFCKKMEDGQDRILVLDNDLNIYHTTLEDVLLRKNPTVKEMISIRNAIKILNDKDVVVSKKEISVQDVEKEAISFLDLSFSQQDIEEIESVGKLALGKGDSRGVQQSMDLFSEILGYQDVPGWFRLGGYIVRVCVTTDQNCPIVFGPILIYNLQENLISLVNDRMESHEKEKIESIRQIALGHEKADREGVEVFAFLKKEVISHCLNPPIQESD